MAEEEEEEEDDEEGFFCFWVGMGSAFRVSSSSSSTSFLVPRGGGCAGRGGSPCRGGDEEEAEEGGIALATAAFARVVRVVDERGGFPVGEQEEDVALAKGPFPSPLRLPSHSFFVVWFCFFFLWWWCCFVVVVVSSAFQEDFSFPVWRRMETMGIGRLGVPAGNVVGGGMNPSRVGEPLGEAK